MCQGDTRAFHKGCPIGVIQVWHLGVTAGHGGACPQMRGYLTFSTLVTALR